MSPRFDLDGTEPGAIGNDTGARPEGLSEWTAKTTRLLVEIRGLLKDVDKKLDQSLEKGDALLAASGEIKEALANATRFVKGGA